MLFSIKIKKLLYSEKSPFQQIDILESEEFGRILTLDGLMMVAEKDEFIYHDMIVHPAMCVHPMIKKVLVIGGGDGGTVRELTRYKTIERIDMVEIDEQVVRVCEHFLPITSAKLKEPRVHLHFEDGIDWVKKAENPEYDLIIVDSTDPVGPGKTLFSTAFYQNCFRILSGDGILINQHLSLCFAWDALKARQAHAKIKGIFPISKLYQAHTPTYASGSSLFGFASKTLDPIQDANFELWNQFGLETRYYNTELHIGAFLHPSYINKLLDMPIRKAWRQHNLLRRLGACFDVLRSEQHTPAYGLDLWFEAHWSKHTRFLMKTDKHLYSEKSAFQQIDILESEEFGRSLMLDGRMIANEKDEFIVHEALVHPALCVNPSVEKVLVIGNGVGGVVRELRRYETISQIDMITADEQVVCACAQWLPQIAAKLNDPQVHLQFGDGAAWVTNAKEESYDLILVAPDKKSGAEESRFTEAFYRECFRVLSKDGILVCRYDSPGFAREAYEMQQIHGEIKGIFPICKVYLAHIPTHAQGYSLFGFASKTLDPIQDADFASWNRLGLETAYYNTDIHLGAFMLPSYVKELLG